MKISPLTLGTVQLGLDYGIANDRGKPQGQDGAAIVQAAFAHGITTLDTSRHYGDAESVIGKFLSETDPHPPDLLVVSKFKWSAGALSDPTRARREARDLVRRSLDELGLPCLPILLYHNGKEESMEALMKLLPDTLLELQEEGLIQKGGISLYYPADVYGVLEADVLAAVQLPVSVFDQRIIHNGGLQLLAERSKIVFARSVFLQGLFFLDEARIPPNLHQALPFLARLRRLAEQAEMSVAEFAFSYVRDLVGITSMVFGAERPEQVAQNAALLSVAAIKPEIREQADADFKDVPQEVITPGLW